MIKNLPSKRYEIFIKVFEQHVAMVQQQVKRAESMQALYNVVRDVMELVNLPNDSRINLSSGYVTAEVVATKDDKASMFKDIAGMIGARLLQLDLHHSGEPLSEVGGMWHDIEYRWYCGDSRAQTVKIVFKCPEEGLKDLGWHKVDRIITCYEYKAVPRETVAPGAHPTLRVIEDAMQTLRRNDEEFPF